MSNNEAAVEPKPHGFEADLYRETCTSIRTTDEISFKLLRTVPLAAGIGSGALTVLERSGSPASSLGWALVVMVLSLLGLVVTFGISCWERRNIQTCRWLISRAANLEESIGGEKSVRPFSGMAYEDDLKATERSDIDVPWLFAPGSNTKKDTSSAEAGKQEAKQKTASWGKTQAEQLIYGAALAAWLVPLGLAAASVVAACMPEPVEPSSLPPAF